MGKRKDSTSVAPKKQKSMTIWEELYTDLTPGIAMALREARVKPEQLVNMTDGDITAIAGMNENGLEEIRAKYQPDLSQPADLSADLGRHNKWGEPDVWLVVDLGLVYGITVDAQNHAVLDMTLTSAACPLTDVIEDQTAASLEGIVSGYRVNWVWMPPWGPDKITDDGREMLRALGFNL